MIKKEITKEVRTKLELRQIDPRALQTPPLETIVPRKPCW